MKNEEGDESSDLICPLSLSKLPTDPHDVAFIWSDPKALFKNDLNSSIPPNSKHGCGHKCSLNALVQYLQHTATIALCPVCGAYPISAVCDGVVMAENRRKDTFNDRTNEKNESFLFRFGKQVYRLAVVANPNTPPPTSFLRMVHFLRNKLSAAADTTVQGRLCQVLQLDDKTLKVGVNSSSSILLLLNILLGSILTLCLIEKNTTDIKERKNYLSEFYLVLPR
jgi:hypothetical protein